MTVHMIIFTMASPDNCYCEAINNRSAWKHPGNKAKLLAIYITIAPEGIQS